MGEAVLAELTNVLEQRDPTRSAEEDAAQLLTALGPRWQCVRGPDTTVFDWGQRVAGSTGWSLEKAVGTVRTLREPCAVATRRFSPMVLSLKVKKLSQFSSGAASASIRVEFSGLLHHYDVDFDGTMPDVEGVTIDVSNVDRRRSSRGTPYDVLTYVGATTAPVYAWTRTWLPLPLYFADVDLTFGPRVTGDNVELRPSIVPLAGGRFVDCTEVVNATLLVPIGAPAIWLVVDPKSHGERANRIVARFIFRDRNTTTKLVLRLFRDLAFLVLLLMTLYLWIVRGGNRDANTRMMLFKESFLHYWNHPWTDRRKYERDYPEHDDVVQNFSSHLSLVLTIGFTFLVSHRMPSSLAPSARSDGPSNALSYDIFSQLLDYGLVVCLAFPYTGVQLIGILCLGVVSHCMLPFIAVKARDRYADTRLASQLFEQARDANISRRGIHDATIEFQADALRERQAERDRVEFRCTRRPHARTLLNPFIAEWRRLFALKTATAVEPKLFTRAKGTSRLLFPRDEDERAAFAASLKESARSSVRTLSRRQINFQTDQACLVNAIRMTQDLLNRLTQPRRQPPTDDIETYLEAFRKGIKWPRPSLVDDLEDHKQDADILRRPWLQPWLGLADANEDAKGELPLDVLLDAAEQLNDTPLPTHHNKEKANETLRKSRLFVTTAEALADMFAPDRAYNEVAWYSPERRRASCRRSSHNKTQ